MKSELGELIDGDSASTDSPFLSIADFFSLLSMAMVYLVIVYASSTYQPVGLDVARLAKVGSGPVQPVDQRQAFVWIVPQDAEVRLIVIGAGDLKRSERVIEAANVDLTSHLKWIGDSLAASAKPDSVGIYLDPQTREILPMRLFIELTQSLERQYRIYPLMLSSTAPP